MMNSSTTMDQIGKYWAMWGAKRSTAAAASPISTLAAAAGGEPSWEEQAFARDAAADLGGCVWPPRSYSCTFCRREFRSAQALGGHMNVHRRDRALLRQGGSSPEDPNDQPQQGALLYRPTSKPSTTTATTAAGTTAVSAAKGGAKNTATPSSYLSTIIKERKNKLLMSMQASMELRKDQAIEQCDLDDSNGEESARTKRRRLDHPSAVALLIFVQPMAAATEVAACESSQDFQGVDHDAKVPRTTIPSPSSSSLLVDQQDVDLELRLGTTPKVT
ncbi:unnamed protein product [Urochloa decumbens]|uniref:C2H2-type domain-containing protein n=1 Tax=Urochloa decumbens TaxID=240449 RepID=A0ABC9AV43_9POAL